MPVLATTRVASRRTIPAAASSVAAAGICIMTRRVALRERLRVKELRTTFE